MYGQPMHVYGVPASSSGKGDGGDGRGELERMTEDEYAAYVRQKMWEKTHAGLLEQRAERERNRAERERERQRATREADEARRAARAVEASLARGEERRRRRAQRDRYAAYVAGWERWKGDVASMAWPVSATGERGGRPDGDGGGGSGGDGSVDERTGGGARSGEEDRRGRARILDGEAVRAFFAEGLDREEIGEAEFATRLKEERVRWHPDKMQQRLGGTVDEGVMKDVTAVFQIIDALWTEARAKATR